MDYHIRGLKEGREAAQSLYDSIKHRLPDGYELTEYPQHWCFQIKCLKGYPLLDKFGIEMISIAFPSDILPMNNIHTIVEFLLQSYNVEEKRFLGCYTHPMCDNVYRTGIGIDNVIEELKTFRDYVEEPKDESEDEPVPEPEPVRKSCFGRGFMINKRF